MQWVNRPHLDFRGFAGSIASGTVKAGDNVVVASSGRLSKIARVISSDGDVGEAAAGDAVTLVLSDEIDIARGDVLTHPDKSARSRRPIHRAYHLDERRDASSRAAPI